MNTYLTIMVTVLVATQVIRIIQNTINLCRQGKLINEQLREIGDVGKEDIENRREVDRLALKYLRLKIAEETDGLK